MTTSAAAGRSDSEKSLQRIDILLVNVGATNND